MRRFPALMAMILALSMALAVGMPTKVEATGPKGQNVVIRDSVEDFENVVIPNVALRTKTQWDEMTAKYQADRKAAIDARVSAEITKRHLTRKRTDIIRDIMPKGVDLYQSVASQVSEETIKKSVYKKPKPVVKKSSSGSSGSGSSGGSSGSSGGGGGYYGGSYGYLYIPSVGISVAVDWGGDNAGAIVDMANRACMLNWTATPVIGDHSHQNFAPLSATPVGAKAYVYRPDGSCDTYTCTGVRAGTNTGYDLVDGNGSSYVYNYMASLCCYTCRTSDWHNVWLVTFSRD